MSTSTNDATPTHEPLHTAQEQKPSPRNHSWQRAQTLGASMRTKAINGTGTETYNAEPPMSRFTSLSVTRDSPSSGASQDILFEPPGERITDASSAQFFPEDDDDNQQASQLLHLQGPLVPTFQRLAPENPHSEFVQRWIRRISIDQGQNGPRSSISSTDSSANGSDYSSDESILESPGDQAPAAVLVEPSSTPMVQGLRDIVNEPEWPTEPCSHFHLDSLRQADSRAVLHGGCSMSTPSAASNCSLRTHATQASWSGRKGLKRTSQYLAESRHNRNGFTYHCTWCGNPSKKPSDWKRHEESQHAPQTEWVCLAEGALAVQYTPHGIQKFCAMCWHRDPPSDHASSCRKSVDRCINKPLKDRKFDRKDHLVQHLRHCHDVHVPTRAPVNFSHWEKPLYTSDTALRWDCGICDKRGMNWNTRYQHIIDHVKSQADLTYWRHCVCTLGYSPTLETTMDRLGFGTIFAQQCKTVCLCPLEGLRIGAAGPSDSTTMYLTASSAQNHQPLHQPQRDGRCPFSCCVRRFQLPIQIAKVPFWCGLCNAVIESSEIGSYDCLIMRHIDRKHIMEGDPCHSWKPIDSSHRNDFITSLKQCDGASKHLCWELLAYDLKGLPSSNAALSLPYRQVAMNVRDGMSSRQATVLPNGFEQYRQHNVGSTKRAKKD